MTTSENQALDSILAECRRVKELEKSAYPLPWLYDGGSVISDRDGKELADCEWPQDAMFLFTARTITPKVADALLVLIPAMRKTVELDERAIAQIRLEGIVYEPSPDVLTCYGALQTLITQWTNSSTSPKP